MKVGDLIKTVFRDEYAIITEVWYAPAVHSLAAKFVYPSDGNEGSQPMKYIKEVLDESRKSSKAQT
jgi:hypothetical protein